MRLPVALHRSTLLLIGSVLLLLGVAAPACAESYSYEGQLQLQASTAKACTALAEASYPIHVYGRDDGPQGIEGYLYGEKVVPAHFIGNALNQLALTFPGGGGQTSTMRLRSGGDGSFSGELPALSMVAALANCGAVSARIRFVKVATHIPADYERAAALYQLDDRSMQLYVAGMKGRVSEAVSALQDGLAQKQKLYAPNHPQLLPYLAFLAQLQEAGGDYAAAVDAYRAAAALCEQSFGADSACSTVRSRTTSVRPWSVPRSASRYWPVCAFCRRPATRTQLIASSVCWKSRVKLSSPTRVDSSNDALAGVPSSFRART